MSVLEIAKRAGVSAATVSRVLNNHPSVRPETLQQVRKALADLNYARPAIRRGPRLGRRAGLRTGNIAVLGLGDTDHTRFRVPVFAAALAGIVQAARDINLNVLIDDVPNPNHIPPLVRNREVDGAIVFLSAVSDAVLDGIDLLRRHMPIVRIMGDLPGATTVDHVGPDHAAVGHLAYEYLSQRNCKNLAFVSRQPTWDLNRTRAMGFAAAAHRDRLVPACFVLSTDSIDIAAFGTNAQGCASDDELADRIVALRPDGLFTSRDDDVVHLYPLLR